MSYETAKIITLAIIYILIFIGVHRKKIYNSVSGIIGLDLKVKYPYLERGRRKW